MYTLRNGEGQKSQNQKNPDKTRPTHYFQHNSGKWVGLSFQVSGKPPELQIQGRDFLLILNTVNTLLCTSQETWQSFYAYIYRRIANNHERLFFFFFLFNLYSKVVSSDDRQVCLLQALGTAVFAKSVMGILVLVCIIKYKYK